MIVDGLTEAMSRQLDTMQRLRSYGTDYVVTAGQPSLSYPNWTNLLSGAPAQISGVTTNDYVGPVKVETLFQTATRAEVPVVFVGPEDFQKLYDITANTTASFMQPWSETKYLSSLYVDNAIRLAEAAKPQLLVVHLPDIDEAGHRSGSASEDYARTARKVDADLGRLVTALQDGSTVFVVAADHGHIGSGGHGGWESVATSVPAVFSGPGIAIGAGTASQSDVAPTVALLAGVPVPRFSVGAPLSQVVGRRTPRGLQAAGAQQRFALTDYSRAVVAAPPATPGLPEVKEVRTAAQARAQFEQVEADKLAADRTSRLGYAAAAAGVALLFFGVARTCVLAGSRRGTRWDRRVLCGLQRPVLPRTRLHVVAFGIQPRRAGRRVHQHARRRSGGCRTRWRGRRCPRLPAAARRVRRARGGSTLRGG